MNVVFHSNALEQLAYWAHHDPRIAAKIRELIVDIRRRPFIGLGKPEPLRGNLKGWCHVASPENIGLSTASAAPAQHRSWKSRNAGFIID